jgi:hypothetical protein
MPLKCNYLETILKLRISTRKNFAKCLPKTLYKGKNVKEVEKGVGREKFLSLLLTSIIHE